VQFRQVKPHPEVSISQHKYNPNYNNPNATGKNPTPLMIPFTNIPIQVFYRFFTTYGQQINIDESSPYSIDYFRLAFPIASENLIFLFLSVIPTAFSRLAKERL